MADDPYAAFASPVSAPADADPYAAFASPATPTQPAPAKSREDLTRDFLGILDRNGVPEQARPSYVAKFEAFRAGQPVDLPEGLRRDFEAHRPEFDQYIESQRQGRTGQFAAPGLKGAKGEKPLNWSDVPGKALENAPASAAKFANAVVQPILHPIDTVAGIGTLAAGAFREGAKRVLPQSVISTIDSYGSPEGIKRMEDAAGNAGQMLKDRYGGVEELKNTLATDPVGAVADASMVLTGGGALAARGPGAVGQAGRTMQTTARTIDPLANAGRVVSSAGRFGAEALGMTTGAGGRPIREAFDAGRAGNQVFTENMRGQRPIDGVVDLAENAVTQMGRERGEAYRAGMAGVTDQATYNGPPTGIPPPPPTPPRSGAVPAPPVRPKQPMLVDTQPFYESLSHFKEMTNHKGVVIDKAASEVLDKISGALGEFEKIASVPGKMDIAAADALKQAVWEIGARAQQGTLERTVASGVYNKIKSEIVRQVPEYAAVMKDYANASDNIKEMRRTLSINDRASTDTTLRKMQSTMRNNVNANFGQREALLNQLAKYEPDLPPALAGQSLNALMPRGLARISPAAIAAGGLNTMNPAALAMLPFTSPRLMGEASYGAGRASGLSVDALRRAGVPPETIAQMMRGSYGTNALLGWQQPQSP